MTFGIAYTHDGSLSGFIVGWLQDPVTGEDLVFDDRDDALEESDRQGWVGYVREYANVYP